MDCLADKNLKILIVDDASTDKELSRYIEQWTKKQNATLIKNLQNIGYIKSVNSAIKLIDTDFILLNSDTEVSGDWSERLLRNLYSAERIAAVTPFSNSATIYSFPIQNADNVTHKSIFDLQQAALVNEEMGSFEAPTINGFCVAVKRKAWNEIGEFNEIKYGLGYGEECDWSMRAKELNWSVNLAPDVFVKHFHGGSFDRKTKEKFLESSANQLRKDWPNYFEAVEKHIVSDPWSFLRSRILLKLLLGKNWIIVFKTNLPGGAHKWFEERSLLEIEKGNQVLEVFQNEYGQIIGKPFQTEEQKNEVPNFFEFQSWDQLREFYRENSGTTKIIFSSLVGYQNPEEVVNKFGSTSGNFSILPGHDYFSVCPSHNLLNDKNKFCGLPANLEICRKCLPRNANALPHYRKVDIEEWRKNWFSNTDLIEYYSNSSRKIFQKSVFLEKKYIEKKHHNFSETEKETAKALFKKRQEVIREKIKTNQKIRIAYVGAFAKNKGAEIYTDIIKVSRRKNKNWEFYVFGTLHHNLSRGYLQFPYKGERELCNLLRLHHIDVCVLPAIWPETYNYVLDEIISLGYSIVVSPIGALTERLKIDEIDFGVPAMEITAQSFVSAIENQLESFKDGE
jgi:O-antigen biosynthesis protein